ncbi:hypothetical protein MPTK1_1g17670 [Marchantia polymorpha subsp. ruderalis]|uniref:Late embryogenesis abundant protein LEA-2 subgroup domain-containing protein n=2 Tax=Marchantia polymorpha TaxID=3197 RepID=A0A176W9Q6_MARPO|nr:hypothetical protein AXG93_773s1170 [Marchantia polymorpha subsp. ruderalis]PTQ50049.1 hypothetical protein MARPO_0001s0107 [Marchantia polymorpha]BBM98972.1 hypothetical protein Mp_1g17670 [Marchantia polymorpha subsp. ruderalis]|eukprot:PTQ50049.1 hypothetical protein MARPO_0001s0107 [Marchantia polymorpha]
MDEETSALLPGRVSRGIDRDFVEDFEIVCKRAACAVTILTVCLAFISTISFVIYIQPEAPIVNFQGLEVREFSVSNMIDRTGVPTYGVLADATMKVAFFNPSIFYETTVKEVIGLLSFERLIAYGEGEKFVQPRLSGRAINIDVASFMNQGPMVPLYGAAPALLEQISERGSVNLELELAVTSEFSMFDGIVRKEFNTNVKCDIVFAPGDASHIPGHSEGVILSSVCSVV